MTFHAIHIESQLLKTNLMQATTYEAVLELKARLTTLIIDFNELEKSQSSDDRMKELKENIKNLRENYRIKIKNLRSSDLPCVPGMAASSQAVKISENSSEQDSEEVALNDEASKLKEILNRVLEVSAPGYRERHFPGMRINPLLVDAYLDLQKITKEPLSPKSAEDLKMYQEYLKKEGIPPKNSIVQSSHLGEVEHKKPSF